MRETNGRVRRGFTDEEKRRFLELIEDGRDRREAAVIIGEEFPDVHSTASRWKGQTFRDPEFAEKYAAALEISGDPETELSRRIFELENFRLLERMLDEFIERGLDPEKGRSGASNRVLQNLLTLKHDVFKPFLEARMHRHIHTGSVGVFAMPQIDTSKWTLEEQEEFLRLDARRSELLDRARLDDETRHELGALPPARDYDVDAEAVEVSGE